MNRGNRLEAKRYFFRALYCDKERTDACYYLGLIYRHEGNEKNAAAFFLKAAGPLPKTRMTATGSIMIRLQALYYLSEILIKREKYRETVNLLESALVQYPMVPRFYTQIGISYMKMGMLKESAQNFMRSINLCPLKNDEAYCGMAAIYQNLGNMRSAVSFLKKAMANQGNAQKLLTLISSLEKSEQLISA
jgi:tetratricopeptide (TPR) repeat protein